MNRPKKILIVDDNPVNVEILEELLDEYDCFSATSGEDALRIIPNFIPDLILLDIMMPGMNGYEVCKTLQKSKSAGGAKIIMVSAKAMTSERLEGYKVGADDYVTKPFNSEELLAKIRVYLRLKTIEEVDRMKTNLLQSLCSETVNPLSKIIHPLKLAMDEPNLPQNCRKHISEGYLNTLNLQQLLEKVVLVNSIKAGSFHMNYVLSDLVELVHGVLNDLATKAKTKNISLRLVLPAHAIVRMDIMTIKRILFSFMDNAIRFSPQDGDIHIDLTEADGNYFLSILDLGEGIDPELIPRLFQEIQYLDVDTIDPEWNGLNLSLAKLIISKHGGEIKVDTTKNQGTNITVILPSAKISENKDIDLKTEVME